MIKATNPPIKLGEFLVSTGVMNRSQINESINMASNTGLPLGRALVLNNLISQKNLDAALRLQMIYRSSSIPLAVAINAYRHCVYDDMTPEQGLAKAGFARQIISYSKLGTLLVDAKIISKQQLDDAQKTSYETGMQLGKMLCFTGAISEEILYSALDLQRKMRDQLINKDQALSELNSLYGQPANHKKRQAQISDQAITPTFTERKIKLGELLLMAGAISEIDVMDAMERSLETNKSIAAVFVETGMISENLIGIAQELQQAINAGDMTLESACESLNYIARTGERPSGADHARQAENAIKLGELLQTATYIQAQDVEFAAELVKSIPSLFGKLLVVAGAIDEPTMRAALRCHLLVRRNELTAEQGIKALKHSGQRRISFDDALDELGLNPNRERK